MRDEFFQLCNDYECIKETLYKYFAEPDALITVNTDKGSCCSYCNDSLQLRTPEREIYNEKGANLDAKKNYILERLQTWAQASAVPAAIGRSALFPTHYTVTVLYTMIYRIACQFHLITTREHLNDYTNEWEHVDLLSESLWQELRAADLKYNRILHPSS